MKKSKSKLLSFILIVSIIFVVFATTIKGLIDNLTLGIDLKGGFEILYQVEPLNKDSDVDMSSVAESVRKRVDILGVNEPQIIIENDDRIRVQLAGVQDQKSARELLGSTANLTFRDVHDNLLADANIIAQGGASLSYDQNGKPVVSLKIKDQNKFAEITRNVSQMTNGENIMVIWLDYEDGDSYVNELANYSKGKEPKYVSAASVNFEINGDSIISGNFTETEARNLAGLINSGSLPVKMNEISSNVISANFGIDALNKTAMAGIIGTILVFLFMLIKYKLPGFVSSVMLIVYIYAIFFIYSKIGAVLTLPGIAALVLGVGMTVDANIITFERIKDELYKGRSISEATATGQSLSFTTILDAQITTLLAGIIMYMFGNGAVKGFATMLIITVFCTLLISVFITRFLLNLLVSSNYFENKYSLFCVKKENVPDVNKGETQFYYGKFKGFDFYNASKKTIIFSLAVICLGVLFAVSNLIANKGIVNLGIDFSSGTKLTIQSNENINVDDVKNEFASLGYDSGFTYQLSGEDTIYATTKKALSVDELNTIKQAFIDLYGIEPGDSVVTPTVGRDLVNNAVMLSILAWVVMMLYITIRFKWDYAISSIIALVHDVFIVLAIFTIFRLEINTELISVILAIIGYSINNSIVVFDRIRELVGKNTKISPAKYIEIINEANFNTFTRSLNSSITTLLPILVLLLIGSDAVFTFTFAMTIGLIAGTYSSIFIAPYIWCLIRTNYKPKNKKNKKVKKEKLDEYTIKGINA